MPPLDDPVKQSADRFFSALDGDKKSSDELGLQPGGNEVNRAGQALRALSEKSDDELFEQIAQSISKDPRITKHLPELALGALSVNYEGAEFAVLNPTINTDKNQMTVSKAEVSAAASNDKAFDPVHQKALQFVVENFDRFRNMDRSDAISGAFAINSPDLTQSDLGKAAERLSEYKQQQARPSEADRQKLRALDEIIGAFNNIDANKSGKISASEGQNWLAKRGERPGEFLRNYLPVATNRLVAGTQLLSVEDLQRTKKQAVAEMEVKLPFFEKTDKK